MKKSIMKYIFFAVIAFGGCVSFCAPMDGCMPVHLESSAFKSNKDYDEYNRVYQEFFRCYRDVINYINNRGDNPEIDALINECREIARSDRWGESRLIVGYSGNVSVACLSNLRTSVSRLSRKINDYFYKEGSKVPKAQKSGRDIQNNRSSQKGNVKDGRELLDPDFLPYCIVSGTAKEWKNAKGKTMRGEWHYISQKGDVIWLYDVEKKKYIKMPVANLSQEDKDYIRGWVSDFLTQGMKWKYGNYLTADQIREVEYILEARTKIFDRSISGRKDIKVVQAWEFGGLCDYGMGNSSSFRAENQNLIYWQTGEKGVLANGDILSNQIMYWAGTTKYETVNHNVNTVACYCNDFDFAIRLVRCRLHLYDDGDKRFDDTTPAPKQNDSPSKNGNKPTGYGSGFFVTENGYLISNYHVVKGAESCFAVTENGRFKLSLIGIDERTDLALLKANGAFVPVSFSRKRIEKLGATVFTAGFPMPDSQGFSPKVTKGIVSGDKGMNDNPMHYQIDASIQPGNSGGPVCDESGNVIAVVVSMLSSKYYFENQGLVPQNVNYAIKKSYLEAFLGNYSSCAENVKDGDTSSIDFSSAVEKVKHSIALIEVY